MARLTAVALSAILLLAVIPPVFANDEFCPGDKPPYADRAQSGQSRAAAASEGSAAEIDAAGTPDHGRSDGRINRAYKKGND